MTLLDKKEIPTLLSHHVPPVDALSFASCQRLIIYVPNMSKQLSNSSDRAEARRIAHLSHALEEDIAEWRVRKGGRACNEDRPDERSIEAFWAGRDEIHRVREHVDKVCDVLLLAIEARDQRAQIDPSSEAEDGRHIRTELLRPESSCGRIGIVERWHITFSDGDVIAEQLDMCAKLDLIHAVVLQCFQASNLGDQEHDAVVAAHELTETGHRIGNVLLAVSVGVDGCATEHRRAKNVDPGGYSHVESWLRLMIVDELQRKLKLIDKLRSCLEVRVPGNVRVRIFWSADETLEENHAKSGLQDLGVVGIELQRFAKLVDGLELVAHDVVVQLLILEWER